MRKIYVVTISQCYDGETFDIIVKAFSTKEKGWEYFMSIIDDSKKDLSSRHTTSEWEIDVIHGSQESGFGSWCAYDDGYYHTDHIEIVLNEVKVDEVV